MKNQDNQDYEGAYFVRVAGKVIACGVFTIEPRPERGGFAEHISPIPGAKLDHFVGSFTSKIADEATILTSPKAPGVELILPPNTSLTAQMVRELILDIHKDFAPKTIAVKPNPAKS